MIVSPIDGPLLFALGFGLALAYRYRLRRHNEDWFVVLGWVAVVGCWLDLVAATALGVSPWLMAPTAETGSVVLAVWYPLAYPFWLWFGGWTAFLFVGRERGQGGVLWLYRIDDSTESFESPWDS